MTAYYKFLAEGRRPAHGGTGAWTPNRWRSVKPPPILCRHGFHVLTWRQLPYWPASELWECEVSPDAVIVEDANKTVVTKARITRRVEAWTPQTARVFACDCAERALTRERDAGRKPDPRSWKAVRVARQHANGKATHSMLAAARVGAEAAAALSASAASAAEAARWDAAAAAAAAAASAAWAAAAWAGARVAAGWDAWAAAEETERAWQADRLTELLNLEDR